jgi:hypothetical protein
LFYQSDAEALLQDRDASINVYTLRFKDEDAGFPPEARRLEQPQQIACSLWNAEFSRRLQSEQAKAVSHCAMTT